MPASKPEFTNKRDFTLGIINREFFERDKYAFDLDLFQVRLARVSDKKEKYILSFIEGKKVKYVEQLHKLKISTFQKGIIEALCNSVYASSFFIVNYFSCECDTPNKKFLPEIIKQFRCCIFSYGVVPENLDFNTIYDIHGYKKFIEEYEKWFVKNNLHRYQIEYRKTLASATENLKRAIKEKNMKL